MRVTHPCAPIILLAPSAAAAGKGNRYIGPLPPKFIGATYTARPNIPWNFDASAQAWAKFGLQRPDPALYRIPSIPPLVNPVIARDTIQNPFPKVPGLGVPGLVWYDPRVGPPPNSIPLIPPANVPRAIIGPPSSSRDANLLRGIPPLPLRASNETPGANPFTPILPSMTVSISPSAPAPAAPTTPTLPRPLLPPSIPSGLQAPPIPPNQLPAPPLSDAIPPPALPTPPHAVTRPLPVQNQFPENNMVGTLPLSPSTRPMQVAGPSTRPMQVVGRQYTGENRLPGRQPIGLPPSLGGRQRSAAQVGEPSSGSTGPRGMEYAENWGRQRATPR